MKKVISLFLIVVMVFMVSVQAMASDNCFMKDMVKVARILGVGSESSKLKTNSIDGGINEIISPVSYKLENGKLFFSGKLNNIPFFVKAIPYSALANDNVKVFEGIDQMGNYQVLYVAVEKEITKSAKYFDNIDCGKYGYMLKLYMRTNHSDDIVIVEVFTNSSCYNNFFGQIKANAEEKSLFADGDGRVEQLWYAKVFAPIIKYEKGPELKAVNSRLNEGTYTYQFNHFGAIYYQYFTLQRYINWPTSFRNIGDFQTTLNVKEAYTEVPGYPNENSNTTYMRINSVQIDIVVDEGDAVNYFSFDGLTHKNANASVTLKFKNSIALWGPLSLQVNYENSDDSYDLNTQDQHLINGGSLWHRQLGAQLQSGHRLEKSGHYFSVIWKVANYSGLKYNQAFKVRFSYNMSNLLDYTHWTNGDKQFTDTVYYNTTN